MKAFSKHGKVSDVSLTDYRAAFAKCLDFKEGQVCLNLGVNIVGATVAIRLISEKTRDESLKRNLERMEDTQ